MSAQLYPLRATEIPRLLIIGDIALFREGIENGLARTGEELDSEIVLADDTVELVREEHRAGELGTLEVELTLPQSRCDQLVEELRELNGDRMLFRNFHGHHPLPLGR